MDKHNYIGKFFWALAPLLWGGVSWFLAFGPGAWIPMSYAVRIMAGILLLSAYFYNVHMKAASTHKITFFKYEMPLINWLTLTALGIGLLLLQALSAPFFDWKNAPIFFSIIFGVCAGPVLEELLVRSFFIKYRMHIIEFIFFNLISSTAMTLMHAGYYAEMPSLYQLFFVNSHFAYSFFLGIIAYKSQRIEVSMIMHMLSNFFRYTLPVIVLHQQPLLIPVAFLCVEYLLLGGISYKKVK